jgi:quercetin dioxygenase-like cupin family protein
MLGEVPVPEQRETSSGHWIGSNGTFAPFVVLHWRLAPGKAIRPHAHSYGNVVTFGLEGEALVRNYEVDGERDYDRKGPIRARLTVEQVLRRGDINLVSLERNYVHGFVAGPDGASGLDITTRIKPKRSSPVLEVGEMVDPARKVFAAEWRLD